MRTPRQWITPFTQWVLVGLAAFSVVAILISLLGWRPPDEFTIATGRQGGAYYTYAQEYQRRFAELGYTLNIRETAGGIETVELLDAGRVDAGFVQNTVSPGIASPELSTLAAIYYEALWIFYRDDLNPQPADASDLIGLRINVGEKGSAGYESAQGVLELNGVTSENSALSTLATSEAAARLKEGELDAIIIVIGAAAPLVTDLMRTPGIELLPMRRASAYTSRFKNVAAVVLPEGVIDFEDNIPSQDTPMIAARATLVAGPTLHPDLARLLLIVATEVHKPGGVFENPNEFPSSTFVGIPMNADAARFLENGPTILEEYLPLWLASRLERFFFLLLPIVLIGYPIVRLIPSLVGLYYDNRINRQYRRLRTIDREYRTYDRAQLEVAINDLDDNQIRLTSDVGVPAGKLEDLYNLRYHSSLVLERLNARRMELERGS